MRWKVFGILAALSLMALTATNVLADQVYHSERLDFTLTEEGAAAGHPTLRHGQVVNIHPNGPVLAAIEKYMVNGAKPNTEYQVWLHVRSGGCGGGLLFAVQTATLATNKVGSAHGDVVFTPEDLAGLSGETVGARWTLRADGIDAYETVCTTVVLD